MSMRKGRGRGRSTRQHPPFDPARRRLLAGVAGAAGALALPGCGTGVDSAAAVDALAGEGALPDPGDSGIDHIVQVMMENRSYDHMLGWVPKSDGIQAGLKFRNVEGDEVETFHLAADPEYGYQGCGWADPAHGYGDGRAHMNGGAMDGWLLTPGTSDDPADRFPVGYYTEADLPFYAGVAKHFTVCDHYFHGFLGSTFPNRIYIHAGQTDRMNNAFYPGQDERQPPTPASLPTVWDLLAAKGLTGRNYFHDLPITAFWADKYAAITAPFEQFLEDARRGTLPNVSYFDPNFGFAVGESPAGVSRDDHPQADVRDGQVYLTEIYNALRASPNWERTLMIVTYDEWGGFYDHVPPPVGPVSEAEAALGNDGTLGFRTPCVILGPRTRRGHVSHFRFDPNSVINLIRWRWNLGGLSARDKWSHNMAMALDFRNPPNLDAPQFATVSPGGTAPVSRGLPYGAPCFNYVTNQLPLSQLSPAQRQWQAHQDELRPLYQLAKRSRLV
jgi:phospholipase C